MKKLLLILLCVPLIGFGQNITIIESQSLNTGHDMDNHWKMAAIGMGLNPTIVPQSTLGLLSNLSSTDVLILSSGLIYLPPAYLQTVRDFVSNGGPVYIQSEYDANDPGAIAFDSLMIAVAADFHWNLTVSGNLNPMMILGDFSTTPNNITSLNYFWWGVHGEGEGVESFLEFNGHYFGFCYVDDNFQNGTVITTSDQDWVRTNNAGNVMLMENILTKLLDQGVITTSWDCDVQGNCYDPGTGNGIYTTQAACIAVCGVNAIEEHSTNKELLKIIDILGREVNEKRNTPLFYIYNDGTVEKRILIE